MVGSASDRRIVPRMNYAVEGLLGRNVVCDTAERGGGVRGSMYGLVLKEGNIGAAYRTGARRSRQLEFLWLGPYVVVKNEFLGNFRVEGRSGVSAVVHGDILKLSHLPGNLVSSPAVGQSRLSPSGVRHDS
jgi:hypothetical protein